MSMASRMIIERARLHEKGLDQFTIYQDSNTGQYEVLGTTYSSSNRAYELWLPVPRLYPEARPPLYVTHPNPLYLASGGLLRELSTSHAMHTLEAHPSGYIQICHWRDERWHAGITLDRVFIKGLLWLEAYEQHLATGESLSSFVRTMREAS